MIKQKRISVCCMVLIAVMFMLFSFLLPEGKASAAEALSRYDVTVKVEVTSAAGGWNSAYIKVNYKRDNATGEEDKEYIYGIYGDIKDKGDYCKRNVYIYGFPTEVDVYTDFGGGFNWRTFEADVTVYVNDVNVAAKHIKAKSSAFSSSDAHNIVTVDPTKYPYPEKITSNIPKEINIDYDGYNNYGEYYYQIIDQYGVYWTNNGTVKTRSVGEGADTDNVTNFSHVSKNKLGYHGFYVGSSNPDDRKATYELTVKSSNSVHEKTVKDYDVDIHHLRTLTLNIGDKTEKIVKYAGDRYVLDAKDLQKEGYVLKLEKSGDGKFVKDESGGGVYIFEKGDGTISAEYEPITYNLFFRGNKYTGGTKMGGRTQVYDVPFTLLANTYKKTGHTFTGWNTEADGSGDSYSDRQTVKNLTTKNGENVYLYAQWKPIEYTVVFRDNVTKEKINQTVEYGSAAVPPERKSVYKDENTHYVFSKWNKKTDKIKGNMTVDAVYTVEQHDTELINQKDVTDDEDGYTGDKVCMVCGETIEKGEVISHATPDEQTVTQTITEETVSETGQVSDVTASVFSNSTVYMIAGGALLIIAAVVIAVIVKKKKKNN